IKGSDRHPNSKSCRTVSRSSYGGLTASRITRDANCAAVPTRIRRRMNSPLEESVSETNVKDRCIPARVEPRKPSVLENGQAQVGEQIPHRGGHGHPPADVVPGRGADAPDEAVAHFDWQALGHTRVGNTQAVEGVAPDNRRREGE